MAKLHRDTSLPLLIVILLLGFLSPLIVVAEASSFELSSGSIYEGEVVFSNVPHGEGKVTWLDGSTYEGTFFNGMMHGKGRLQYAVGDIYEGNFVYGLRSGKGKMLFANGDSYNGEWQADMMHGRGKYIFKTPDPSRPSKNDTYDGQWRFNMMHGNGEYKYAKGTTTTGYWVMNAYGGRKLTAALKAEIGELN